MKTWSKCKIFKLQLLKQVIYTRDEFQNLLISYKNKSPCYVRISEIGSYKGGTTFPIVNLKCYNLKEELSFITIGHTIFPSIKVSFLTKMFFQFLVLKRNRQDLLNLLNCRTVVMLFTPLFIFLVPCIPGPQKISKFAPIIVCEADLQILILSLRQLVSQSVSS